MFLVTNNINKNMTKEQFEKTLWYRLLKVIYIIVFIFVLFISLAGVWSEYDVYVPDYEVRNSPRYIEENRDGIVGRLTERLIKEEMVKEQKQTAVKNIILFTPIIVVLVWFISLVIKRLFFYIGFGEKFIRFPQNIFD